MISGISLQSRRPRIAVRIMLLFFLLTATVPAQRENQEQTAITAVKRMLRQKSFPECRDSLVRLSFTQILNRVSWQSEDVFVIGTQMMRKDPLFFLGPMLRGFYLSVVSTDRRGHEQALKELEHAMTLWPADQYVPRTGNLDAVATEQFNAGISQEEQFFTYMTTYYYLQLNYQLSSEYLELNEARRAYEVTRELLDKRFAYDFYSQHRLAWLYYKYRYFQPGKDYPFLAPSLRENVRKAIDLSREQMVKIHAYRAMKYSFARYWTDDNTLSWYEEGAKNILSIAYGVIWQVDSSIVYYERIPSWYQIRNNGIYTYLSAIKYRDAERQFEIVGKSGNQPLSVISQPTALESYKNILIYKGTPEEGYEYLDDYPRKYQTDRGWSMSWTGAINYWNGHLGESIKSLNIARQYPEVFGNISFNRTHYDMLALTQQSLTYEALANQIDFEPNLAHGFFARVWNWILRFVQKWYYRFMAFLCRHWAIDHYLQIEDRAEYLKVFYPENLCDYFQTWNIIGHLDPHWHLEKLHAAMRSDARPRAQRYYQVFEADLLRRIGRKADAFRILKPDARDFWQTADTTYEKLLIAMAEHNTIELLQGTNDVEAARHTVELYRWYPQAANLWGHRLPLRFDPTHADQRGLSAIQQDTLAAAMKALARFDFDTDTAYPFEIPALHVSAENRNGVMRFSYSVVLNGVIVSRGEFSTVSRGKKRIVAMSPEYIARSIAYGVFRIVPKTPSNTPA